MDIVLKDICFSYPGKSVLMNFSHRFPDETASCIMGASGCGKTTLLHLLAGLLLPTSGSIEGMAGRRISMLFQEDRLPENLSVQKNIMLTARRGFTTGDAVQLLAELGLQGEAHKRVASLSGGMRRRVALARALAAKYDLLLLDEPLTGLDARARQSVLQLISARTKGKTLICATHDASVAEALGASNMIL